MKITEAFEGPAKELGSQLELPISSTAQHSSISLTPTIPMSNISVECYNKTLAMKTFLQQINVFDKRFHKSNSNNLRIEGEALTEAETMEKVRAIDEKRNKKKATKRNKDYANDANILSK